MASSSIWIQLANLFRDWKSWDKIQEKVQTAYLIISALTSIFFHIFRQNIMEFKNLSKSGSPKEENVFNLSWNIFLFPSVLNLLYWKKHIYSATDTLEADAIYSRTCAHAGNAPMKQDLGILKGMGCEELSCFFHVFIANTFYLVSMWTDHSKRVLIVGDLSHWGLQLFGTVDYFQTVAAVQLCIFALWCM